MDVLVVSPVGSGPFPLIVFCHGYNSLAQSYASFLEEVARHGYVVAGPNFVDQAIVAETAAVTSVVSELTSSASPLGPGLVDSRHIAVAGHSWGGLTAYGVAYNTCCHDARIAAALSIEAPEFGLANGTFVWQGTPLLMVLGDNDPLIPSTIGAQILSYFHTPAYLLTVLGGNHGGGIDTSDPAHNEVLTTILTFLDAYLKDDPTALRALRATPVRMHTTFSTSRSHPGRG